MPKDSVRPPTRGSQPYTSGLGMVFSSPKKRRDKKKSTTFVTPIGSDMRKRHLLAKIERLKANQVEEPGTVDVLEEGPLGEDSFMSQDTTFNILSDNYQESSAWVDDEACVSQLETTPKSRRLLPNTTADELYARWMAVLPRLVPLLTSYTIRTMGVPLEPITNIQASCMNPQTCVRKNTKILCLFVDRKSLVLFQTIK